MIIYLGGAKSERSNLRSNVTTVAWIVRKALCKCLAKFLRRSKANFNNYTNLKVESSTNVCGYFYKCSRASLNVNCDYSHFGVAYFLTFFLSLTKEGRIFTFKW